MIISKAALQSANLSRHDQSIPGLDNIKIEKDGTVISAARHRFSVGVRRVQMDWKAFGVLIMFIGMTAGYNASIEPTINDSATQVSNELYHSFDNSWLPSTIGGWFVIIAVFAVLLLALVLVYVVFKGLGWLG